MNAFMQCVAAADQEFERAKLEEEKRRIEERLAELGPKPNGHDPNASQEWEEPLDLIGDPAITGWPELSEHCLPAPLHRYVRAEAERLNVDPCPLAVHVIAACASSISDAWRIKPKKNDHWTQQARIWSCVIKDVGSRGTDMIRAAFWPVEERNREAFEEFKREHAEWKRRSAKRDNGDDGEDDPEPKCRRLMTQDATVEAAGQMLADGDENSKLTVRADELMSFFSSFSRYSTKSVAARALWLESYDGGPQHIDRIIRGHVYVPNWSLVVAGNIQPRKLADAGEDLAQDGLFQRFLTVHTRPPEIGVDDDRPLAVDEGGHYRDLHRTLADLMPVMGADKRYHPVWVDDEGRAERQRFMRLVERLQIDPTLPYLIRETVSKWSGLVARISLTFHLVELAERQLQGATLETRDLCKATGPTVAMAAEFLLRVALPNLYRLAFETMPEEGTPAAHARWIAGFILAHGKQDVTARDIGRANRQLRGKHVATCAAMDVLCDAGWSRPAESRKDAQRWEINPKVHSRFAKAAAAEKERREALRRAIREEPGVTHHV